MNRRILPVAAAALVAIAAVWAIAGSDSPRPTTRSGGYKPDVSAGRALALDACREVDHVVEQVKRDASAPRVLATLDRLEHLANRAYERDVRWVRLLSAAKALAAGLRDDDQDATRAGIETARAECRPLTGQ